MTRVLWGVEDGETVWRELAFTAATSAPFFPLNPRPLSFFYLPSLSAFLLILYHRYYIGIIDILQEWTIQKRLERAFKRFFLFKSGEGLSAIEPRQVNKHSKHFTPVARRHCLYNGTRVYVM